MRRLVIALLAAGAVSCPVLAFAAPSSAAECKAHLAGSLASMPADRFAEELAGAEGLAGNATPAIRSAAIMLTDLYARTQERAAELAALKDQLARVETIAVQLAALRAKDPTSTHFIDANAEPALNALQASLTARVTLVNTTLESERAALDQNLQFHCTAGGPASSAAAH